MRLFKVVLIVEGSSNLSCEGIERFYKEISYDGAMIRCRGLSVGIIKENGLADEISTEGTQLDDGLQPAGRLPEWKVYTTGGIVNRLKKLTELSETLPYVPEGALDKPPVGVMPEKLWMEAMNKERIGDLVNAISNFAKAGIPLPEAYSEELIRRMSK